MNPMLARIPRTLLQLFFLGVVVSLALSLDYVYATHGGWHGPTAAPPGNNVAAPLNVGNALQGKGGGLTIGSTLDVVASTTMSGGLGFRTRGSALTNPAFTIDMGPLPEGANYGIRFADGSVQLTAATAATGGQVLSFDKYLHLQHRPGIGGYAVPQGWNVRPFNIIITNTITGASLSSNRVTLPVGTYYIQAKANAYSSRTFQSAIYNVTAGSYILFGIMGFANGGTDDQGGGNSIVSGVFTLGAQSQLEVRFGAYETGLCYRADLLIPGGNEANYVCTDVEIWKLD